MPQSAPDLNQWLERLASARSCQDVFQLLDAFRLLAWSDEDRARMSRAYIRVLKKMTNSGSADETGAPLAVADGPVWYEKM